MSCATWAVTPSSLHAGGGGGGRGRRRRLCPALPAEGIGPGRGHRRPCASAATNLDVAAPHLLHDSLDAAGFDTSRARAAREAFKQQVGRLTTIGCETSIAVSRGTEIVLAALHIEAEDESLAFPCLPELSADMFFNSLDGLSMEFCSTTYLPPCGATPEAFLHSLERFLYIHKGFRRTNDTSDTRPMYLYSALTSRSASVMILSFLYSEILKVLRMYGLIEFDAEIYVPNDATSLPRGYDKRKTTLSDVPHIMTSKSLLVKMLKSLKDAFWPFRYGSSNSLFLRAVDAPHYNFGTPDTCTTSYSDACCNTNAQYGNMRRALATCERLILLNDDPQDLRDYAALLYHCGYFEESLRFLIAYQTKSEVANGGRQPEQDAVKILTARVNLILAETGWSNNRSANKH